MSLKNLQDGNVGNLGDILKHAALLQLARVFAQSIPDDKYYLDSHSYLYHSQLAVSDWRSQVDALLKESSLYQDYIDIEMPFIERGDYLCSSGLIHRLIPDAHLLLCESNRQTREWLLQQLADEKVRYHTVKEQMIKWVERKSFRQLPNLLALIDPFDLTDELWKSVNRCMGKMVSPGAPMIMLVFDYKKQLQRDWPDETNNGLNRTASLSLMPYHLAVYASHELTEAVNEKMRQLGWDVFTRTTYRDPDE